MTSLLSTVIHGISRCLLTAVLLVAGCLAAQADGTQKSVEKPFTVCPLNVDGLPTSILGFNINPDGKGEAGATDIGNYLKAKGIDVLAFSEDFNYHDNLIAPLSDDYMIGTYRGGLNVNNYNLNIRFNTDGLEFLTRKAAATFSNESWTEWNQCNGKFTNGADELIRKGFRYYTIDLGDGVLVDVYTMHMDADTDPEDNAARASQWTQLCNVIKAANTGRPVIVMGDTNSRYTRDDILNLFTNPLSDLYDVRDVWVEKCKGGTYPTLGSDALMVGQLGYTEGEIVDKVIYLNPKNASLALTANSITFDKDGYVNASGEQLGDHVPVIVNFTAKGTVTTVKAASSSDFWRGETWTGNGQQVYLYNVGSHHFISNDFAPTVTDITQAPIWGIYGSSSSYTISNGDGYRVRMESTSKDDQGVVEGSGASTFSTCEDGSTTGSYRFGKKKYWTAFQNRTRFFGIATEDGKTIYTAAETKDSYNEWLLISETQKQAYLDYVSLYNEALSYADVREDLADEFKAVLDETSSANYSTYASVKEKLEAVIAKYEKLDVKISSAKYATTCLPWNATVPEGVTVYIATKYTEGASASSVHLEKFEGPVLPKGVGFVLYSDEAGTYTFTRTADEAENPTLNILSGTYRKMANATLDFDNHNYMLLGNKQQGVGFYRLDASSYIPAYRAYILRDKQSAASEDAEHAKLSFDETSGVKQAPMASDAIATGFYGTAGEKRSQLERGLNIVRMSDGTVRKVMVK